MKIYHRISTYQNYIILDNNLLHWKGLLIARIISIKTIKLLWGKHFIKKKKISIFYKLKATIEKYKIKVTTKNKSIYFEGMENFYTVLFHDADAFL